MTKKELQKQIDKLYIKVNALNDIVSGENKKLSDKINLLLNYLGLEIITEKSIKTTKEYPEYDLWGFPISPGKEIDEIKYTDKIVKKTKKSKR